MRGPELAGLISPTCFALLNTRWTRGGLQHSLTGTTGTSTPPRGGRRGVWAEGKRITPEWWGRAGDSREVQAWRRPEWQRRRRETRALPAHTGLTLNSATTAAWAPVAPSLYAPEVTSTVTSYVNKTFFFYCLQHKFEYNAHSHFYKHHVLVGHSIQYRVFIFIFYPSWLQQQKPRTNSDLTQFSSAFRAELFTYYPLCDHILR